MEHKARKNRTKHVEFYFSARYYSGARMLKIFGIKETNYYPAIPFAICLFKPLLTNTKKTYKKRQARFLLHKLYSEGW